MAKNKTLSVKTLARRAAIEAIKAQPAHVRGAALAAGDTAAYAAAKQDGAELFYAALKERSTYATLPALARAVLKLNASAPLTTPTSLKGLSSFAEELRAIVASEAYTSQHNKAQHMRARRIAGMITAAYERAVDEVAARNVAKAAIAAANKTNKEAA
jgi:hypothetical protein